MRHDVDPLSLLFGLLFGGIAVAGLNGWLDDLWTNPDLWSADVVVPTVLILLGLLLGALAWSMLRRRAGQGRVADGPTDELSTGG